MTPDDTTTDQLALDLGGALQRSPVRRQRGAPAKPRPPATPPRPPEPQPELSVRREGDPADGTWSALRIAHVLGRPRPTAEQIAVIEAPVAPLLVVAGAGSGKTETMASRVVWLVANGHVRPEEVLGLTFTRKAAGELSERIRSRLRALGRQRVPGVGGRPLFRPGVVEPVSVSTYHSYAAALLSDHGLRLGVEPSASVLGQGAAWQIVDDLVQSWEGDMGDVGLAASTVANAVLDLAGECSEHLLTTAQVEAELESVVERAAALPAAVGGSEPADPRPAVRDQLARLRMRLQLMPLVEAYARRKREMQVLDFGDQVALAARLATEVPAVGASERLRFRVVLLDEYQDTSHAQLVMLRALFGGGHPVTAVGDPHQSIYGWRGASAGNLQRFPEHFPEPGGSPSRVTYLSTSWRNNEAVLAVANRLAEPLRTPPPWTRSATGVDVDELVARPGAGPGRVEVRVLATVEDEAREVADVIAAEWTAEPPVGSPPLTAAVLCRKRSQFPLVEAALRARDIPVVVVGLGGLLHLPEIADLRAALEVVHDPSRGDSLMRLLTGSGWQIGPRDLEALARWSREVVQRLRHDERRSGPAPDPETEGADLASIIEAIDELPPEDWQGPQGQELSAVGRARLVRLGDLLRGLRSRTGLSLPELIVETERALGLDIEVAARPGTDPATARTHLDAFVEVAAAFADGAERAGLGAFLSWLKAAESAERGLEPGSVQVSASAVQLLTVHAAKGLEWDVVAVPGLVEGGFPTLGSKRVSTGAAAGADLSKGWLGDHGAVPYELRGDVDDLPSWRIDGVGSQDGLADSLVRFTEDCGLREMLEERRLVYVAVTRARRRLLLTGALWGDAQRPRIPSRFLDELAGPSPLTGVDLGEWAEPPAKGVANPREALERTADWPLADPFAETGRGPDVAAGADLVRQALAELHGEPPGMVVTAATAGMTETTGTAGTAETAGIAEAAGTAEEAEWAAEVDLLLAERDAARSDVVEVELPAHVSASRLVALAADPWEVALQIRRPLPREPSRSARQGSRFHAWLEQRFGAAALVDVDDLPGSADAADEADLADLQATFLASEWAGRTAEAVEVAVETPVDGIILRGRIDAVFATPDGGWDVVDWKTGAPPSPSEAGSRAVQLAVYRLAWARLKRVPLEQVRAAFFYASTGRTVRPVDVLDEAGLVDLLRGAVTVRP